MATKAATRNIQDYVVQSESLSTLDLAIAKLQALMKGQPAAAPASSPAPPPAPTPTPAPAPAPASSSTPAAPAKPRAADKPTSSTSASAPASGNEATTMFSKVLIKVARIQTVDLVENSEKLYKLSVDIGGETRQVCAGLRQYLAKEDIEGKLVCAVCNLKPAKLAGIPSEAMLLAGETETADGLVVRLLVPPAGSAPGEQLYLQGGNASTETVKQLKSDHWKVVAGALHVAGGHLATVAGTPLVTDKGNVTVPAEIPDGSAIH